MYTAYGGGGPGVPAYGGVVLTLAGALAGADALDFPPTVRVIMSPIMSDVRCVNARAWPVAVWA